MRRATGRARRQPWLKLQLPSHVPSVGGALLAIPAADTLKRVQDGRVVETIDRSAGRLAWTLDGSRENDCVRHAGFWLVRADPSCAHASLVYYSADVQLAAWCPAWLNAFISEQGLPLAVGWLRREAERRGAAA